jgi:hypothetical protein
MGTLCAYAYATIYYSFHEEIQLITNPNVLFYAQLINDVVIILLNAPTTYEPFVASMNNFGPTGKRLEWEAEPYCSTIHFLDLTVTLSSMLHWPV